MRTNSRLIALALVASAGVIASGFGVSNQALAHAASTELVQAKTAEEVFTRYVEALGGDAKVRTITTRYVEGIVENTKTKSKSRLTAWQKAPNLIRIELESPGLNTFDQGYDGKIGWMKDVRSARVLEGDDLAGLMESADFYTEIEWKRKFKKMELMPDSPFDGKSANVVKVTNQSGKVQIMYFDAATGLLAGYQDEVPPASSGAAAKKPSLTIVGEYKDFDGVKFATRYVQRAPELEIVTTYRKVEMNAAITTDFAMPQDVKDAIESSKKAPVPTAPASKK